MYSDTAEDSSGSNSSMGMRDEYTAAQTWPWLTCPVQHKRVDFSTTAAPHGDLDYKGRETPHEHCGIKTRFLQPYLHYSSSGSSRTRQTRPSADVRRETTACWQQFAFLRLPLHSDDWQKQLRPRRLTLHHLCWFVLSSRGTRRALQWMSDLTPLAQAAVEKALSAAAHPLHSPGVYHWLSLPGFSGCDNFGVHRELELFKNKHIHYTFSWKSLRSLIQTLRSRPYK